MTTRDLYSGSSSGMTGVQFLDQYYARLKRLLDVSAMPLTSVGGTADVVTASLDPALDGDGLVDGMKFSIIWGAANTGAVTLNVNSSGAVAVKDKQGSALAANALASGMITLLEYRSGSYYCLSNVLATAGDGPTYEAFTSSGTWTKPAGIDSNRMIFVELWGAGGGGGSGAGRGGGGGGAYEARWFRAADLGSTETVTIGAGGAVSTVGGDTTFGSLLTAGGGRAGSGSGGGNGAGIGPSSDIGAGAGNSSGGDGSPPSMMWAGAGGGDATNGDGGDAIFGGAGGGGNAGNGGASSHGGDGGDDGIAGSVRGGGGGGNAAGGRGELRVWIP